MTYVVEPPIGALNVMINNGLNSMNGAKAILLGALLGGMMSVDMGGPVNKAAYVFGTASIAAGNYNIMAAVMVGGMVPPLAIALATMFFKNKLPKKRESRTDKHCYGTFLYLRGSNPVCSIGSIACAAVLYHWFRSCRSIIHGI